MGYQEGRIEDAVFVIRADRQRAAFERMLELSRDRFGYDLEDRNLADLDGFLALFAIETVRDGDDIVGLRFEDRILLEIEDVLLELAPYVEAGSYVLMHGGSGARWRYEYDGRRGVSRDAGYAPWYGR